MRATGFAIVGGATPPVLEARGRGNRRALPKRRDRLGSDGLPDVATASGVEDPVDAEVDPADLVLLHGLLQRERLLPARPSDALVVDGDAVELIRHGLGHDVARLLVDQAREGLEASEELRLKVGEGKARIQAVEGRS